MAPIAWWHYLVGGMGGEPFQHARPHDPVSKIETWTTSGSYEAFWGIKLTHVSGTQSPLIGTDQGTLSSFTIAYGERLTTMTSYTDGPMFAGFNIVTDKGRSFMAGKVTSKSYWQRPYSGFIVAVIGRVGSEFDQFSFGMLDDPQRCDVDMNYTMMPQGGISDVSVVRVTKDNIQGERDADVTIGESVTVTSSLSTTKTWGESLGVSVSVSGKVFGIGAEGSTEYTYSEENSESSSYETSKTTDISASMHVPPGKKYLITALYYKGTFNIDFRPKYRIVTSTGFTANFPEGPAQPVSGVASGNMIITTIDITNMPQSEPPLLATPPTEIGVSPDNDDEDEGLIKSIPEARFGNVLTRKVLDGSENARNFQKAVGVSADDK
ncbi:uncharacterized protein EAF01_001304 [Botrytis porri]|uniref:Jacalin-type lectin domain-containing protein n=1 Tax=Botrytis porri TaxID=87229 RepID=A0A4Z1K8G2_9HELO|nr:uncharacterized protein EAF01_001304 [Botrytis porri]KAF7912283.1 hypothetical protein EAF01_001304 [Botrytis porri]TGO81764.1 hypothetical protein BPOR_1025g00020 [Botrytis porri]